MYGTVATMKAKPGSEAALKELMDRWWQERAPKTKGPVSSLVFRTDRDANEYIVVAVFDSKANYVANADDPEQDKWYRDLRSLLNADPDWHDGEIVFDKQI